MSQSMLVHVVPSSPAPHGASAVRTLLIPLHQRNPDREYPPELDDLRPTPLETEARREPIVIDPLPPPSQHRVAWALGQLVRFVTRWLHLKLTRRLDDQQRATLTRQLFERMSGMWIKAGQLLSLRADLMSPAMTQALASLQYQARGFPPDIAKAVIEEELGRPLGAIFSWFEAEPFAAASIAQVHRATLLRNNRAVIVKVMRPDVARSFSRDLRIIEFVVRLINRLGLLRHFRLADGVTEMRAILTEETDYQYEAVNLKRMRRNLKDHGILVPRVINRLSRRRVLVMEEVPGVLMSQYIRVRRDDPDRAHRWALTNGIEDKVLARRLSTTTLRQILEDNEFHGDLHPGNIMLLADNNIALIDFGSVGRLTQHAWTLYRYSLSALALRDYERAADLMLMLSPSIANANTRRLRQDLTLALRNWALIGEFSGGDYSERSMAAMSTEVARVMADHRVPVSWAIMRVGRTLSTLDASLQTLVPHANFMSLARAYFKDRQRRSRTAAGRRRTMQNLMRQATGLVSDIQLLVGTGVRDQALRLHGMLDAITQVRIVALTFLQRGLQGLMIVILLAAGVDEGFRPMLRAHTRIPEGPMIRFLLSAVPDLHPIHWVLLILGLLYLRRVARNVLLSIARLE
jgi:ubiquinone biosynthesis protein